MKTTTISKRKAKYDMDTGLDHKDLDLDGFKNYYQAMWRVVKVRKCKMEDLEHPEEGYLYHLRNIVAECGGKVEWWMCWKGADAAKDWEEARRITKEHVKEQEASGVAAALEKAFERTAWERRQHPGRL